jgi:hypothetical protein
MPPKITLATENHSISCSASTQLNNLLSQVQFSGT